MITQDNIHKVSVKVNSGSGVLVKINQKYFVITVIHCLLGDKNTITNYNSSINYDIKDYFYHENGVKGIDEKNEDDIVLVEVESPQQDLFVEIEIHNTITIGDTIHAYGFPNKGENDGTPINGKISKWHDTKTIETDLTYIGSNSNAVSAIGNILGWSGSGCFKEIGKKLYLIGILKKLQDEEYSYQSIDCISIKTILEVIKYNNLSKIYFSNPSAEAFEKIKPTDTRNLEDKLNACTTLRSAKVKQYIRAVSLGKSELLSYDERQLSSVKNFVFEKCQDELMSFIDNLPNGNELRKEDITNLLERYTLRATEIINDKRSENNYPNFSNDTIEKIILDLIDTCYLSFDEEGIYE